MGGECRTHEEETKREGSAEHTRKRPLQGGGVMQYTGEEETYGGRKHQGLQERPHRKGGSDYILGSTRDHVGGVTRFHYMVMRGHATFSCTSNVLKFLIPITLTAQCPVTSHIQIPHCPIISQIRVETQDATREETPPIICD